MRPSPQVYLVDDEADLRLALTRLLKAERFEVTSFESAEGFLAAGAPVPGSCLVLDLAMPGLDGIGLQQRLLELGTVLPIVFLTGQGDIPSSVHAFKSGAFDFLLKPVDDTDLLRAVRAALAKAAELRAAAQELAALRLRYDELTLREQEVFKHLVTGQLNKQIAGDLGISLQTIKVHRSRVMKKMEVVAVADLVRAGRKLGLTKEE